MAWEVGQRYRAKVAAGQIQVEKNPKTGTPSANAVFEVTAGPQAGQRLRWRGYLNSRSNQETTVGELRAMGWGAAKLGDWKGVGTKEFEFTCLEDDGDDGRKYKRAAFVRPVTTVKEENAVHATELDELNASMAGVLAGTNGARGPVPMPYETADDAGTQEIPFP